MKRVVFILLMLFFIGCKTDKNKFVELNEKDAYELMNEYFLNDVHWYNDNRIFSEYQFKKPSITVEDVESIKKETYFPESIDDEFYEDVDISNIEMELPPHPFQWSEKFTKKIWSQEKLINVSFFEKRSDTISSIEALKLGVTQIHNVSYPIYYHKERIAVIYDEPYYIGGMNCILETNYYVYIKEKNGWRSLKEFGITGIYGTLHQYYNEKKKLEK